MSVVNFDKDPSSKADSSSCDPLENFIESVKHSITCLEALQPNENTGQRDNYLDLELALGNLSAEISTGSNILVVTISSIKELNKLFGQTQVNEALKSIHSSYIETFSSLGFTLLGRNFKQLTFLCSKQTPQFNRIPFKTDCASSFKDHITADLITIPEDLLEETDSDVERNYLAQRYASFITRIRRIRPDSGTSSESYLQAIAEVKQKSIQSLDILLEAANQKRDKFIDEEGNLTHFAFDLVRKNKIALLEADNGIKDEVFKIIAQYVDLIDAVIFVSFFNQDRDGKIDTNSLNQTAEYWNNLRDPNAKDYTRNHFFLTPEGKPFLTSEVEFHRRCLETPSALYCGVELVGLGSTITASAAKKISNLSPDSNMRQLLQATTGLSDEMFNTILQSWQHIAAFVGNEHPLEAILLTSISKGDSLTFAFPVDEAYQQSDMVKFAGLLRTKMEEKLGIDVRTAVALSTRIEPGIKEHCAIVDYLETLALDLAKEFEKQDKKVFILFDPKKVFVIFVGEDGVKSEFEISDMIWILKQEESVLHAFIDDIIKQRHSAIIETDDQGMKKVSFPDTSA